MWKAELRCPDPEGAFYRYNNRVALFRPIKTTSEYWRQHWTDPSRRTVLLAQGQSGSLGEYERLIKHYVPKDLPVLEAGCGLSHIVMSLKARGYEVRGVDYDNTVVTFINEVLPNLDVKVGDVRSLDDVSNASLGCYLSLGVVEHFAEGPEAVLAEAKRVLHPRGIALISVPYANPVRQTHFGQLRNGPNGKRPDLVFYQYYFGYQEFAALLRGAGLEVIDHRPLFLEAHLIREHPLFSRYWTSKMCRHRMKKVYRHFFSNAPLWLRERYGHMMMYVCRVGASNIRRRS